MKTTTVKTEDLLTRLKTNREKHRKQFKEAYEVWRKKSVKALQKAAKNAKNKGKIDREPLYKLPKPQHYLKSYDRMISRLEAEVRPEVELDDREFASYWDDDWEWHGSWVGTTSLYSS